MNIEKRPRSKFVSVLRTILFALLFAFVFGFVFGTVIRQRLEAPKRYIGWMDEETRDSLADCQPLRGTQTTSAMSWRAFS